MAISEFIAETDVSGAVVWVWRLGGRDRIARPVEEAEKFVHELAVAKLHGAKPEAFSEWFERRAGARLESPR